MRFGRRRKKKEKQRAAWDAVAATLETPRPLSVDDVPAAAAPVADGPDLVTVDAQPDNSAFSPIAPVTPASTAAPAPVAPGGPDADPTPLAAAPDVAPADPGIATGPPAPSGPPVFRFTPAGATEMPASVAPASVAPASVAPASVAPASVAPTSVAPLAPVPDPPEHIPPPGDAPSGLASAAPLAPLAPSALATAAPLAPSTLAPQPSLAETAPVEPVEPVADPPVAAPRAPEPHATLPVVFDAPPAPQLPAPIGRIVSVPLSTRAIADRMRGALDEMVQLSMHMDAWMDQAVEMRTQLLSEWDDDTLRPTYTDFVVRAVGRALVQHPELNAIVRGDDIELLPRVHVGITLPGRDGVDIPVVRDADRRTLKTIAAASLGVDDGDVSPRSLAGPASADSSPGGVAWHAPDDGPLAAVRASPDSSASALDTDVAADVAASFVVASLGIYGVDAFTPVVMSPNVATLAIGRVRDATRWEGDHPTRATTMTLTLAWDHRAVDGTTAAEFLAEVRDILEQPYRLLVD